MVLILSIETASTICSVALHQDGAWLAGTDVVGPYKHANCLMATIDHLFKVTQFKIKDLSAVAVAGGPGSYTGLRIGTSVGKGLCFGLDIPLIAIGSLEALAYSLCGTTRGNVLLCPVMDAKRDSIYMLIMDHQGHIVRPAFLVKLDKSFHEILPRKPLLFFGDCVKKCQSLLGHYDNIQFLSHMKFSATHVGALAFLNFRKGVFQDLLTYEPCYLS